jgi:simple sugar transport system permease protein
MTFVILSGGIDLSVGSVIAFTGVFLAKAIGFWGYRRWWRFRWCW